MHLAGKGIGMGRNAWKVRYVPLGDAIDAATQETGDEAEARSWLAGIRSQGRPASLWRREVPEDDGSTAASDTAACGWVRVE